MKREQFSQSFFARILTIATILMSARSAYAQVNAAPPGPSSFAACLFSEGSSCEIVAATVGLRLANDADHGPVVTFLNPTNNGFETVQTLVVKDDLAVNGDDADVAAMAPSDSAGEILAQLSDRSEAAYFFPPTPQALKLAIGFTADATISAEDYVAMLKVHMEMTLGVSSVTSEYLVNKMVMQIQAPPALVAPAAAVATEEVKDVAPVAVSPNSAPVVVKADTDSVL